MKEGKHVGRPRGRTSSYHKVSHADDYILAQRKAGRSKNAIARELGVSWDTIDSELRRLQGQG